MNADRRDPSVGLTDLTVFSVLMLVMAATRLNHFGAIPDASWAVFFIAGFYLHAHWRWMFPLFLVNAVAIDYLVISGSGLNFWSHYCVSPGYWLLAPAYFSLWLAGQWTARAGRGLSLRLLGRTALAVVLAAVVCQILAQGGFYWFSDTVANPSLAGWWKNYTDWLPAYTLVMSAYVVVAAIVHVLLTALQRGHSATIASDNKVA